MGRRSLNHKYVKYITLLNDKGDVIERYDIDEIKFKKKNKYFPQIFSVVPDIPPFPMDHLDSLPLDVDSFLKKMNNKTQLC